MEKKIVLAGGTGNLGKVLTRSLLVTGYEVYILTRKQNLDSRERLHYVHWDGENIGNWVATLEHADVLINMTGESINTRFTAKNKQLLYESRISPTKLLGDAINLLKFPPSLWLNFSGISIFEEIDGEHSEESRLYGDSFLAILVQEWESAFWNASAPHTRKSVLRVSPVLSRDSGMFSELLPLSRCGLGGTVGSGRQFVSWIHEVDFCRMVLWVVAQDAPAAVYHACTPFPVQNKNFMKALRNAVGMSFGLPLPTFLAKVGATLKGVDSSLLLSSVHAVSDVALREGFEFIYPTIEQACAHLVDQT